MSEITPIAVEVLGDFFDPLKDMEAMVTRYAVNMLLRDHITNIIWSAMRRQVFVETSDDAVNYSDELIKNILYETIQATVIITGTVSEDAGEIVMESLQESFSNALQSTIGGYLTAAAGYRGGANVMFGNVMDYEFLPAIETADQDALTGLGWYQLIPTRFDMYMKANRDTLSGYDEFRRIISYLYHPGYYIMRRMPHIVDELIARVFDMFASALEGYIRRAMTLLGIAETVDKLHSTTDPNGNPLIDDVEYNMSLLDIYAELEAISDAIDELLQQFSDIMYQFVNNYSSEDNHYIDIFRHYSMQIFSDVYDFMKDYIEYLADIRRLVKGAAIYTVCDPVNNVCMDISYGGET